MVRRDQREDGRPYRYPRTGIANPSRYLYQSEPHNDAQGAELVESRDRYRYQLLPDLRLADGGYLGLQLQI